MLRTRFGRGEALADLTTVQPPGTTGRSGRRPVMASSDGQRPAPALRVASALVTGVATWLAVTARRDLAPRDQSRESRPTKGR